MPRAQRLGSAFTLIAGIGGFVSVAALQSAGLTTEAITLLDIELAALTSVSAAVIKKRKKQLYTLDHQPATITADLNLKDFLKQLHNNTHYLVACYEQNKKLVYYPIAHHDEAYAKLQRLLKTTVPLSEVIKKAKGAPIIFCGSPYLP